MRLDVSIPKGEYCWAQNGHINCQFMHRTCPDGHIRCGLRTIFEDVATANDFWDGKGIPKLNGCLKKTK